MWNKYVEGISHGWPGYTPEGVLNNYAETRKRLTYIRGRLDNPVNLKMGGHLKPSTIKMFKNKEKELIRQIQSYRKLIKCLVKYNLLPTNKLISGEDRKQFVFSLWTMLELPELGKAVYYANRLMSSRYGSFLPSTNEDYIKWKSQPGTLERKKMERSRESMCDALIQYLTETIQKINKERPRFLYSGTPWKAKIDNQPKEPGKPIEEKKTARIYVIKNVTEHDKQQSDKSTQEDKRTVFEMLDNIESMIIKRARKYGLQDFELIPGKKN